jgi:hypothetical protein
MLRFGLAAAALLATVGLASAEPRTTVVNGTTVYACYENPKYKNGGAVCFANCKAGESLCVNTCKMRETNASIRVPC